MPDEPISRKNAALDGVLTELYRIDRAVDLRWLNEELAARVLRNYRAKLHGISGGHEQYDKGEALQEVVNRMAYLDPADLKTLRLVVGMLYRLMQPQTADARGTVQRKTITREHPVIDWAATAQNGGVNVYVTDENGKVIKQPFQYTYVYIRQYAGKADADRKGAKLLSIYADQGMGKDGTGGYVAAALHDELVTEDEILDAWHAGRDTYEKFINQCADLLTSRHKLGNDE